MAKGLLAKKVLLGQTVGSKNHPQLQRFKNSGDPVANINHYLSGVEREAFRRGITSTERKSTTPGRYTQHRCFRQSVVIRVRTSTEETQN